MPPAISADPRRLALIGIFLACLSTSLGGATVALTRLIISDTDPLSLTFVRYGIAALVLLACMLPFVKWPRFAARDLLPITVLGILMFAAFPFFMARALEDTTSARGGLLFATMPIITMTLAGIFRIEKLNIYKIAGVAISIAGAVIALGERVDDIAPNALRGDILMFIGMVCVSFFNALSKPYLMRYGSLPVTVLTMFQGVTVLLVLAMIFGKPFSGSLSFDLSGWTVVLLLAIPGGAIMVGSWNQALKLITPTQAAITVGLNPVAAIVLGAILLSEPVTFRVLSGFILVVVAIFVSSFRGQLVQLPAP
ncbi:MAG: DMT family transporter [Proteobacteria bacterium]|nr:DMT family transporter [Pseudomonadota bacterium]